MKLFNQYPILLVPLGLLLAFLLLPFLGTQEKQPIAQANIKPNSSSSTGFLDYDLLSERIKQRMEELSKNDTLHRYSFYYFFETDDINRHYYLDDNPQNMIVEAQVVENPEALKLVDERLIEGNKSGFGMEYHPEYWENARAGRMTRASFQKQVVYYVFPEYEADFRDLRVGIVKDTSYSYVVHPDEERPDSKTYAMDEVDIPPSPLRGEAYLYNVVSKYLNDQLVYFQFYDMEGVIKTEFTVGGKASSPQIVEGFSTRESERDEAFKLDGLIVKALNDLKVRWVPGWKNGKRVNTRIGMDVYFAFDEEGAMDVSFSELYPATNTF